MLDDWRLGDWATGGFGLLILFLDSSFIVGLAR